MLCFDIPERKFLNDFQPYVRLQIDKRMIFDESNVLFDGSREDDWSGEIGLNHFWIDYIYLSF